MDCGCGKCLKESSDLCIHSYADHLRRLQAGDSKSVRDQKYSFRSPSGNELTAFLDIGAEAERRKDVVVSDMRCTLDSYKSENASLRNENCIMIDQLKELQKKATENENIILSLTAEIDEIHSDAQKNAELKCQIDQLEREKECLFQKNDSLKSQIAQYCWKLAKLQDIHNKCPNKEELACKEEQMCCLKEKLAEAEKKITDNCEIIASLKTENCNLEMEVAKLRDEWESRCEQFADKSASYQKTISELKDHISCLEKNMHNIDDSMSKLASVSTSDQLPKVCETFVSKQICEQDRIRQRLIDKIDQRDKCIQQLSKIQSNNNGITQEDYNELCSIIEDQANEISQLTFELQSKSLEDTESVDLLNEIAELQYAVYDSSGDGASALLRRIKRIRCRIKSRLHREEARRKELARQLGLYRCQFIHIQKEIEELRQKGGTSCKEEIKLRVEQEKVLSQCICLANKQKKELLAKCACLNKALINIDKVNEFVKHLAA